MLPAFSACNFSSIKRGLCRRFEQDLETSGRVTMRLDSFMTLLRDHLSAKDLAHDRVGWLKTVALRATRHRGITRVGSTFTFAAAAYNPVGVRALVPVAT